MRRRPGVFSACAAHLGGIGVKSLLAVVTILAILLAASDTALADPPTLAIAQRATLTTGGIVLTFDVNCATGSPTAASLTYSVNQDLSTTLDISGSGAAPFIATGKRQQLSETVLGPFHAGDAVASAQLFCDALFTGQVLGATINITSP